MRLQIQTECLNTGIFIIDGLQDTDLQTARALYDDMGTYTKYADIPSIQYRKISSRGDFFAYLEEIRAYCTRGGFPILHLEVHGNKEQGIFIGNSRDNVPWHDLVDTFRASCAESELT